MLIFEHYLTGMQMIALHDVIVRVWRIIPKPQSLAPAWIGNWSVITEPFLRIALGKACHLAINFASISGFAAKRPKVCI